MHILGGLLVWTVALLSPASMQSAEHRWTRLVQVEFQRSVPAALIVCALTSR